MSKRLASYSHYRFLDGYSGYNQIPIWPGKDYFTCPSGTFAYRRMPFSLQCSYYISKVHDDNILQHGRKIHRGVHGRVLSFRVFIWWMLRTPEFGPVEMQGNKLGIKQREMSLHGAGGYCIETSCFSKRNWSRHAKIQVIEKLLPPTSVKGVCIFLWHVGFYRQFINDFSKITKPLCNLLMKDVPFEFTDECLSVFNTLKENLTSTPVIVAPD